jgi:hypothetical protein
LCRIVDDGFVDFHGRETIILWRWLHHWDVRLLCNPLHQLPTFTITGTICVDEDIFRIAGCVPEQVEDGDSVIAVRLREGVTGHPDLPNIRNASQSGQFRWIRHLVIPQIQSLKRV